MANFIFLLILCFGANLALTEESTTFEMIFNYFGASNSNRVKDISEMTLEELGVSRGKSDYNFIEYISHAQRYRCTPDDKYIKHLIPIIAQDTSRKAHLTVKCLQQQPSANSTTVKSSLLMMTDVKDIVELLKPIGNATKRHEPGSCVIVLFYTDSSLGCALVAPYVNILPYQFPTLRVAAIDALEFPRFNTEFGIVGLPTLLLFHQGRPIVKFYTEVGTFANFITKHTGIRAVETVPSAAEMKGPLPLKPTERTDYNLILAWGFIFFSAAYYFAKTETCKQIIEVIQRTWRESEARMENN